jgi:predicted RNase H-like HicB family nuclease
MVKKFYVMAEWDDEAKVWFVADTDVPGLSTEAPTVDAILHKLKALIPELLELNGVIPDGSVDVPFSFMAELATHREHC